MSNQVYKTRYAIFGYCRIDRTTWRLLDLSVESRSSPFGHPAIGPHYASKAELLADLDSYARQYGVEQQS